MKDPVNLMIAPPPKTIPEAARLLGITGRATMNGIHARFHELVKEYHPYVSEHDPELSHITCIRIKETDEILIEYGMNYELSFREEDIRKGTDYDSREFWMPHFGDDPLWG